MDNLKFIRETMERASSFTAVSGWGEIVIGATALFAASVASLWPDDPVWLAVWLTEAVLALVVALFAMARKARRTGTSLVSGPARKFALSFSPPIFVGALMTVALWRAGQRELLPGVWLAMYGTAVMAGGAFSVQSVIAMGACFVSIGVCALFAPAFLGNLFMALGFGVLHIAFGAVIVRRHGG